jgi:hypothetical protein
MMQPYGRQKNLLSGLIVDICHITLPSPSLALLLLSSPLLCCRRYLIEDGKLNLCLRNLIEYKSFQRTEGSTVPPNKQDTCDKFEKGLGVVLRNAWSHVEAVQTTDIQALINHIGDVLDYAVASPEYMQQCDDKGDLAMRQEVVVFYYLIAVLNRLDELHEDRFDQYSHSLA